MDYLPISLLQDISIDDPEVDEQSAPVVLSGLFGVVNVKGDSVTFDLTATGSMSSSNITMLGSVQYNNNRENVDLTSIPGEDVAACVMSDEVTDTCCSVTVPGSRQRCNAMNV